MNSQVRQSVEQEKIKQNGFFNLNTLLTRQKKYPFLKKNKGFIFNMFHFFLNEIVEKKAMLSLIFKLLPSHREVSSLLVLQILFAHTFQHSGTCRYWKKKSKQIKKSSS